MEYVVTVRGDWQTASRAVGLSYRDLARLTGKSLSAVKSYGMGRRSPSQGWLLQVESILATASKGPEGLE